MSQEQRVTTHGTLCVFLFLLIANGMASAFEIEGREKLAVLTREMPNMLRRSSLAAGQWVESKMTIALKDISPGDPSSRALFEQLLNRTFDVRQEIVAVQASRYTTREKDSVRAQWNVQSNDRAHRFSAESLRNETKGYGLEIQQYVVVDAKSGGLDHANVGGRPVACKRYSLHLEFSARFIDDRSETSGEIMVRTCLSDSVPIDGIVREVRELRYKMQGTNVWFTVERKLVGFGG